jgi:TldD protein
MPARPIYFQTGMAQSRRDFVRTASVAAAGAALLGCTQPVRGYGITQLPPTGDPLVRELAMRALEAARSAGASYADVRILDRQDESVSTRDRRVQSSTFSRTYGFGVRSLVNGAWGFVASSRLERDEIVRVARESVSQARANATTMHSPYSLAPAPVVPDGRWRSPARIDPFTVSLEEKADLLIRANEAALAVSGVRLATSDVQFVKEEKTLATTDGSFIVQTLIRTNPVMVITAVDTRRGDFQTRQSTDVQPMGLGYEHVLDSRFVENAPRWAEEAVQKLSARPVEAGRYDLVLHPTHLFLTIHESIGHATELDRAMGHEANYAGTSFLAPPEQVLGSFRYGPEFMQIQGNRSEHGSLAATGWDDEAVRPDDFLIVRDGVLRDYQTTREQAVWLDWWYRRIGEPTRSHGCSYAQSWADVQFQRMPNVSLLPGERDLSWDDVIAATDRGIAILGRGTYSIDQQRYNGQFGGQVAYEIRGGRIVGMLRDVAYQMRTPDFWNSMDLIGGRSSYMLGGTFNDGKGQPSQVNAVSHGCPAARFRQVSVINTGS